MVGEQLSVYDTGEVTPAQYPQRGAVGDNDTFAKRFASIRITFRGYQFDHFDRSAHSVD